MRVTRTLNYDRELPHYRTRHGVLPSHVPGVVHAPPLLWAEALDRLMREIISERVDWRDLRALSGSAQQHGSVYLNADAAARVANLDPGQPLIEQLTSVLSRATSPVWMDSSTTAECREIETSLGVRLVATRSGGATGGGSQLTPEARDYIRRWRAFSADLDAWVAVRFHAAFAAPLANDPTNQGTR